MSKRGPDLACPGPRSGIDGPIGEDYAWLDRLIRRAGVHASELRDTDIRFVDSFVPRLAQYEERTFVSDRQRKWLHDIERRLDEAGVPVPDSVPGPRDTDDPGSESGAGEAMVGEA